SSLSIERRQWPFKRISEQENGSTETKDLAVEARHAPLGRRAEGPDLCRGQELGRASPPAPHRPEDRHVSRPSGSGAEGKLRLSRFTRFADHRWPRPKGCGHFLWRG